MVERAYLWIPGVIGTLALVWWLMRRSSDPARIESFDPGSDADFETVAARTERLTSRSRAWATIPTSVRSSAGDKGVRDPYAYVPDSRWVTVVVDSRDRDLDRFPRPDTYEVRLSEPLRHVACARLVAAEIPSTYYVFTEARGNTTMRVTVSGVEKVLQIPDGNYGIQDMVRVLIHVLKEAYPTLQFDVFADPITHGLGIRSASTPPVSFSIATDDYVEGTTHWGLPFYLGFPRNAVVESHEGRLEGTRPVILNPETYMMLDIAEFGSVQEMGIRGKSRVSGTKPFAKIPIQVHTFEYTFLDTPSGTNEMHPPIQQVDKLSVRWRFHDGTPVSFEDVDHSMTLEVLCTRGRNVG